MPLEDGCDMVPHNGVFVHPKILALGMKLLLSAFIHNILSYFRVALSQLTVGAWRILLNFETLCNLSPRVVRARGVLCRVHYDARSFAALKGCDKLIVNMPDSDQWVAA